MKRVIEVEFETEAKKFETVLNRFFKKFPNLEYWREMFQWMYENNKDFECDNLFADGMANKDWRFALHLDVNCNQFYLCVIERA